MFGRRPDGRRIRGIDPIVQITPYLMPMRCDAQVMLKHNADMERMSAYIRRQKRENGRTISHMELIIAAYVRAVSQCPQVNRFIMNKQYYSRNNCTVSVTILKDPKDADLGETVIKVPFDLTDTIFEVSARMQEKRPTAASSRRIFWTSWWTSCSRCRSCRGWWRGR